MPHQDIEQFVKERNEAIASMDENKIRAMFKKWNESDMPKDPEVFWGAVHKCITGIASLPAEFRHKSKLWLKQNGWSGLDDGDLHTSDCCKELAVVGGKGTTQWYECSKCGKACDLLLL